MSNPNMPNLGAGVMTDTLDFVKSLWGSMGIPGVSLPGIAAPTLSVDDLDKKINELKAVESWLNLNSTMLRSSIQALEVQRGTIAALKSMGQSLAASMAQSVGSPDKSPFGSSRMTSPKPPEAKPEPAAAAPAAPAPAAAAPEAEKPADKPHAATDAATAAAAQMANPAIWWNLLQEQFKQAVSTAMAPEPAKPAAPKANGDGDKTGNGAPKAAASSSPAAARKPAAKRPPKPPKNAN
jgi:hypothetical protein